MEIVGLLATFLILLALTLVNVGIWAIHWSVQRGFNEVLKGMQSLDQRLLEFTKK